MDKHSGNKFLEYFIDEKFYKETWYYYLTGDWHKPFPMELKRWRDMLSLQQRFNLRLPSELHCHECGIPMTGFWGNAFRFMGSTPSSFSPKLCSSCEQSARKYEVGAEVELTMIFADVRDSTPLAETLGPSGFKEIIGRFYKETSKILVERNAMVNRLMGDQVIALFVPRFVGKNHAEVALEAAKELLRVTGHSQGKEPWIPVGVGVHSGIAYVGAVGAAEGVTEIAVLGSSANLCARLSSKAAAGEILISEAAVKSGNLDVEGLESRSLELKGVNKPVSVQVIKV
ncbi:MAG: adenylate/guanylate cyclase domain-containing protein [Chloroflexi bacterium]|nr:adenylate/guanylate cyclase domain-containing protein [Chloroflexota bacterium]MBI3167880.1 adenylate/guanylate cyclase domain-containing protein [Chloroflexota bacterium]